MDNLKNMLTSINLNNLLAIFDIQIAIAVALVFILFRGVFSSILIKTYYMIIKKDKKPKDSQLYKFFNVLFILIGIFISVNLLPVSKQIKFTVQEIFKGAFILISAKAITSLIYEDTFVYKWLFKKDNKTVNTFVCKIIRAVIWVAAYILIAFELGFIKNLTGLFTALGIFSAAIALAAQEIVKSLIGGMEILTDKPFVIGDWIEVGNHQGTVIDITYRSTRIKSYNNAIITIPNSSITAESIINWNRLSSRRFETNISLSLDTTSDKLKKIVKEMKLVLDNHTSVIKDTVEVHVNAISSSSVDIFVYLYVKEIEYAKFLKIKEELLCSLLFLVEKENIELAYPTQTVYLKKGVEEV